MVAAVLIFFGTYTGFIKRYHIAQLFIIIICFILINFSSTILINNYSLEFFSVSSAKFIQWIITGFILIIVLSHFNKIEKYPIFWIFLTVSLALQLVFSLWQVATQTSLFGQLFTFLGQPAKLEAFSFIGTDKLARAFGTTPHPNILGGILGFYCLLIIGSSLKTQIKTLLFLLTGFLLLLTLSKTAIFATLIGYGVYFLQRSKLGKKLSLFVINYPILTVVLINLIGTILLVFILPYIFTDYYIETRTILINAYSELFRINGIFMLSGMGFLTSIPMLFRHSSNISQNLLYSGNLLVEPIHNTLLLGILELGFPFILLIIVALKRFAVDIGLLPQKRTEIKREALEHFALNASLLVYIAIILTFDHYVLY